MSRCVMCQAAFRREISLEALHAPNVILDFSPRTPSSPTDISPSVSALFTVNATASSILAANLIFVGGDEKINYH